jgi:hypothetical protein
VPTVTLRRTVQAIRDIPVFPDTWIVLEVPAAQANTVGRGIPTTRLALIVTILASARLARVGTILTILPVYPARPTVTDTRILPIIRFDTEYPAYSFDNEGIGCRDRVPGVLIMPIVTDT